MMPFRSCNLFEGKREELRKGAALMLGSLLAKWVGGLHSRQVAGRVHPGIQPEGSDLWR